MRSQYANSQILRVFETLSRLNMQHETTRPHRFHRPAAVATRRHDKIFILDSWTELDISVRVQLFLALARLDVALKLVPRRVQFAQPVLERVASRRRMTREAMRVTECSVEFEDRWVQLREGRGRGIGGFDGRWREVRRHVVVKGAVMQPIDVLLHVASQSERRGGRSEEAEGSL